MKEIIANGMLNKFTMMEARLGNTVIKLVVNNM
jgi:hypothetical protein